MASKWLKTLAIIIFYLGLSRALAVFWEFHLPAYKLGVISLLEGKGDFPAQYRVLGPWCINFIAQTFHIHLYSAELVFYWLTFFFAFFAFRFWLSPFLPKNICELSPVFLIALTIGNVGLRFSWDALTFLFMPLMFGLLYRKKWAWLVITFAIATLARETSFLVIIAMAILALYDSSERKYLIFVSALCTIIWIVEKLVLINIYGQPLNSVADWKLQDNLKFLLGRIDFPIDEPMLIGILTHKTDTDLIVKRFALFYSYPFYLLSFLSWANFAWVLIFPSWKKKDVFLRRLAWLIPIHILIMLFVGILFEKRIYFELYPIVMALALQTFFERQKG